LIIEKTFWTLLVMLSVGSYCQAKIEMFELSPLIEIEGVEGKADTLILHRYINESWGNSGDFDFGEMDAQFGFYDAKIRSVKPVSESFGVEYTQRGGEHVHAAWFTTHQRFRFDFDLHCGTLEVKTPEGEMVSTHQLNDYVSVKQLGNYIPARGLPPSQCARVLSRKPNKH
jgi:hypothetical protein